MIKEYYHSSMDGGTVHAVVDGEIFDFWMTAFDTPESLARQIDQSIGDGPVKFMRRFLQGLPDDAVRIEL